MPPSSSSSSEGFAQQVLIQAIERVCVALGFQSTTPQVLECLADVIKRFIQTTSEETLDFSEIAGRSCPGIHDVIPVLSDEVRYWNIKIYQI